MGQRSLLFAIVLALAGAASCFTITNVSISQKTALERQLVGEFEPLTDAQALASSVRAASGSTDFAADDAQARAVSARQRQLFNRDDIEGFKASGCLGEAENAVLVARACASANDERTRILLDHVITQENDDRAAIISSVAASEHPASGAQRAQLRVLYHRLILEQARPGDWIEEPAGKWRKR